MREGTRKGSEFADWKAVKALVRHTVMVSLPEGGKWTPQAEVVGAKPPMARNPMQRDDDVELYRLIIRWEEERERFLRSPKIVPQFRVVQIFKDTLIYVFE